MTLRGIAVVLILAVGAPLAGAEPPPLRGTLHEGARVRLFAPSVVAGPLIGTVVAHGDDFVVVDMEERLRVRVPRAAITRADLSTSRRRQTWKGVLIGAVVLGGVMGATARSWKAARHRLFTPRIAPGSRDGRRDHRRTDPGSPAGGSRPSGGGRSPSTASGSAWAWRPARGARRRRFPSEGRGPERALIDDRGVGATYNRSSGSARMASPAPPPASRPTRAPRDRAWWLASAAALGTLSIVLLAARAAGPPGRPRRQRPSLPRAGDRTRLRRRLCRRAGRRQRRRPHRHPGHQRDGPRLVPGTHLGEERDPRRGGDHARQRDARPARHRRGRPSRRGPRRGVDAARTPARCSG